MGLVCRSFCNYLLHTEKSLHGKHLCKGMDEQQKQLPHLCSWKIYFKFSLKKLYDLHKCDKYLLLPGCIKEKIRISG